MKIKILIASAVLIVSTGAGFFGNIPAVFAVQDGTFDLDFGESGRLYFRDGSIKDIAIDDQFMYLSLNKEITRIKSLDPVILSQVPVYKWTIEKRALSTGQPDPGFGDNGTVIVMATSSYSGPIAIDSQYMYIAGGFTDGYYFRSASSSLIKSDARIEKRDLKTGSLDSSFAGVGVLMRSDSDCVITDIAVRSGFLYLVGYKYFKVDSRRIIEEGYYGFCIEKRNVSDGALDSRFANGGVMIDRGENFSPRANFAIDDEYIYIIGEIAKHGSDWYFEKRRLSDGGLDTNFGGGGKLTVFPEPDTLGLSSVSVDAQYVYLAGDDDNLDWRIEKRDKKTGVLDSSFGNGGIITEKLGYIFSGSMAIDDKFMYVAGGSQVALGMLQKRFLSDGRLDANFGNKGMFEGNGGLITDYSNRWPEGIPYDITLIDNSGKYLYLAAGGNMEKRILSGQGNAVSVAIGAESVFFNKKLMRGMKDNEVMRLQEFLKTMPDIYPEKFVTGYFGPLTEKALMRFQAKYGIVNSGDPVSTGYGQVGPKTRAKLNELFEKKEGPG